ncbi:unnamed protein product [Owenia fusiformis]|uniref:Uncharacterized protein n=1 Tax=Owenia fusiformis TaxID=6347 RepID=A0A8J1TAG5_OWEFU|nr:unnamed protein product [Owenia fusiformis]
MEGDIGGVRIVPSVVEFYDTEIDAVHRLNVTVKNISKTSKSIRYYGPNTEHFKLKVKNPDKPVAAGLEVPAIVEFCTSQAEEFKDRLVITVDDDVIEIPLHAYPSQPILELDGPVDFGNVVKNSKVIAKEVTLYNHGSKAGDFKIKYSGDQPIAIIPSSGTVPAKTAQIIKVEYVTKLQGKFEDEAKVKLDGQDSESLRIMGNVVEGKLELLSPQMEESIDCVKFGATYYGTDKTEMAFLSNNGPEPCSYVCVLEEDAIGQEVGVDLTKSTAATIAKLGDNKNIQGDTNPMTSLVAAIPNQGVLQPYEKIPIFFRFSPRWEGSKQGFNATVEPPPRKDFALFMKIQMIGSNEGFCNDGSKTKSIEDAVSHVEVALTGTALPVLVNLSPQSKFDFQECPVGEHVDMLCSLNNESSVLPLTFQFRRIAHFTAHPTSGKIKPGQNQSIVFSFAPNQVGTFKPTQLIDIIGQVADNHNPFLMHIEVIHTMPVYFIGRCDPITRKRPPKFNPGITPAITNEVGQFVDTKVKGVDKHPRNAILNAPGTKIHQTLTMKDLDKDDDTTLVAFPNDRLQSIRPSERHQAYKTIFTHTERHNYVDPDYAFTDAEEKARLEHKQKYVDFIDDLRQKRMENGRAKEFKEFNNEKDIGIKVASGIKPRKLTQEEIVPDPRPPTPPNAPWAAMSSKVLREKELSSTSKPVVEGLNALPTTAREKKDCSKMLSPQELHQVIIGPPVIDYGEVCLRSVSTQELNITNNLNQYVHVVVDVDCRELRQTSPLSQVVPPNSKAALPLIFESNTKGRFQRSVNYQINGFYKRHVTVLAEVVPVDLVMSTEELTLLPCPGLPVDAGYRGVVTLSNKLNYAAMFTWQPILGNRGTAFSIRPATGMVDAFKDLDCEVVFHPSYMAPEEGLFALQIHDGGTQKLKCFANIGPTNVQFIERRIMFGQIPLNLTTTRTAMLHNTSQSHAFFEVIDPNPLPGLCILPVHGSVPTGGYAELKAHLQPDSVIKFDTRVSVAIRGWKTLELRMGGTVEPPCVDIDVSTFNLGGVYCGSSLSTEFRIVNKTSTKARIELDLTRYSDFCLSFQGRETPEDNTFQLLNPGSYTLTLDGHEVVQTTLTFTPTEVASYDFVIPVTINQIGAPSPAGTPFPPTPAPSNKNTIAHIINPRPIQFTVATPRRRVVATALRQPLQMSHLNLDFSLSPLAHEMQETSGSGLTKGTLLVNNSDKTLKWCLDLSKTNTVVEQGIFQFLHSSGVPFLSHGEGGVDGELEPGQTQSIGVLFHPKEPGHYEAKIPVVLNDEFHKPYQFLKLVGELKAPRIWFDPLAIVMTPVPLDTEVSVKFHLMAANYEKGTKVTAELPIVECEDGSTIPPLTLNFPEGQDIKPCSADSGHEEPTRLLCNVTFKCPQPVSFTQSIKFTDSDGNSFLLPVSATSDNCLLSCYPFLAQHRADHQIVCEQGTTLKGRKTMSKESVNVGEAVFVPCVSPARPYSRRSTTATSSQFECSESSYESTSHSATESTYQPSTPRDGAHGRVAPISVAAVKNRQDIASRSLGSALFPDEDTEEGIFHTEVLLAVQRWFSSQGWPGGPHPIFVPHSLRTGICKKPPEDGTPKKRVGNRVLEANNLNREFKTVYDMIAHLCGRQVPGIPINSPLPSDPEERAKYVHWMHSTLLTFLKNQGACVAAVKPEYLMEPADYKRWIKLQQDLEAAKGKDGVSEYKVITEEDQAIEDELFEAVSKRAWVDILLQILKILVMGRITPRQLKNMPNPNKNIEMPTVNPDPLCSNIYSVGERIILAWLNHHYEQQRYNIWQNCSKGGVPPSRWIVNFDFDLLDGLVLAAALGAHLPFLVKTHLQDMYTQPNTAEQCLHNALKLVNALRYIGIDYDIQAIDITDPNPISLMLLVVYLYQKLPQYLPKSNLEFVSSLHSTVMRQVKLSNPSGKPLTYHVLIAGHDAQDFSTPKGDTVIIAPKQTIMLTVEFTSRFLRPAEAVLVLVGRRAGSAVGSTLVFNLRTTIDNISPKTTIKCESPAYELTNVPIDVENPFNEAGDFRIVLVEAKSILGDTKSPIFKSPEKKTKKVRSKIDNGKKRAETPEERISTKSKSLLDVQTEANQEDASNLMSACFCPMDTVHLEANGTSTIELHFLPFHTGKRQCSIIFINEKVGEFLYSIEANATLPLSSPLPHRPSQSNVRITSAYAAGHGRGMFGGNDSVIYWKCECGQSLKESLSIPVTNAARENALVVAAQQHMSELEIKRRRATGTLASATVTAKTVSLLSTNPTNVVRQPMINPDGTVFRVEVDSEFYKAPKKLYVPNPVNVKSSINGKSARSTALQGNTGVILDDGTVDLPMSFKAKNPGHYPCRVILRAPDDIRVYQIECTVNPEGHEAHLEFTSPVHQSVTQDIPIINETNHDWPLKAELTGEGFYGPPTLIAKAFQTSYYPLMFRPMYEGDIQGKVLLKNTADNTEHVFHLSGQATKPLALEHIVINCEAKKSVGKQLVIPNVTKKKLAYRVESDIPFLSGVPVVTVLSGQTAHYDFTVAPLRHGRTKGVIAFIAGTNPIVEVDSDGEEIPGSDDESEEYHGYRIWYSVEVICTPPPPEKTLQIRCACQKQAILEVGVTNPVNEPITLEVMVEGQGISGPAEITLPAFGRSVYELKYFPGAIGKSEGSLTFFHKLIGEFWYKLDLIAEQPAPTTLPHMECELGRWSRQFITLNNPTDDPLELFPTISNTNNFKLERDSERPLLIRPHTSIQVPLNFMPSTLGQGDHAAEITFYSEKLGEWKFYASGTGLLPRVQDPVSINSPAGSNATLIIPFRNPLDHSVLVDVILTDKQQQWEKVFKNGLPHDSPFCLLLKHSNGIRLGPKSTLDIPVSFAPEEMSMFEALCVVAVRKEDGGSWHYTPVDDRGNRLPRSRSGGLHEIRWLYPINGIPEVEAVKDNQGAIIECQARERVEERLEVTLSGVAPSSSGPQKAIRARAVTPKDTRPSVPEGVIVGEGNMIAEEFTYRFIFEGDNTKEDLENACVLNLVRSHREKISGLVDLVFNVIFSPYKQMTHDVQLLVQAATGGVWKFPVRFIATEPVPDDTIVIDAVGLNKQSSVGFRLNSQSRHPVLYNAFFVCGSDPEFSVSPQNGELLPDGTSGTLITISFMPTIYGKTYKAKLVIQSPDMQWTYAVKGVLPTYTPPRGQSSRPMAGPHSDPRKRGEKPNYIRDNLKLSTTAVSSPIKGAPILKRQ